MSPSKPISTDGVDEVFERLDKAKSSSDFLKFKEPEGKTRFVYRFQIVGKPVSVKSQFKKQGSDEYTDNLLVNVKLIKVWNDDDVKAEKTYRLNLSRHAACERWFVEYGIDKLDGKIFDLSIYGKAKTKKATSFMDYRIAEVQGERAALSFPF
jgi:hypothetical protein